MTVHLESDRLRIRAFCPAEFEDYFGYIMEPELQRMLGLNGITDQASARETFDWLRENRTFLALEKKETGKVIGHICVHPPIPALGNDPAYKGEKGFTLSFAAAKVERRKGYMADALGTLIRQLFDMEKADYIDCETTERNFPSQPLQKKLGFVCWGRERMEDTDLIISVLTK